MTATTIRAMKEFRLLAWPSAAVTACAALALVMLRNRLASGPINAESLTALGFFAGLPVLAGLGIGYEFQYRTLSLTLAQPIERDAIWRAKNLAALAAIALPAGLFCLGAIALFFGSPWL